MPLKSYFFLTGITLAILVASPCTIAETNQSWSLDRALATRTSLLAVLHGERSSIGVELMDSRATLDDSGTFCDCSSGLLLVSQVLLPAAAIG